MLASWVLALLLLIQVGGALSPRSAFLVSALLAALWGAHRFYSHRTGTRRLAVAMGLLAILMASGGAAGAISQLGLALDMPLIDPWLAKADGVLGFSAPAVIAWMIEWPQLPRLLAVAYASSFPLLFGTALLLAFRGEEKEAWRLSFLFSGTIVSAACWSALFPAVGAFPYYKLGADLTAGLPPGSGVYHLPAMDYFRNSNVIILDMLKLQGVVTFPSFHTALAIMTAFAWRHRRWIFYPMVGWNLIVIVSTIPIGGHYGVDLLGGLLLWAALAWCSNRLEERGRIGSAAKPERQSMVPLPEPTTVRVPRKAATVHLG